MAYRVFIGAAPLNVLLIPLNAASVDLLSVLR